MLPESITGSSEAAAATSEPDISEATLGREDFLRMLIAQLENQDPLNPQDATEFTAQLAQFSSLEQLLGMRQSLEAVAASQLELSTRVEGLASSSLVGREVTARSDAFEVGALGELVTTPSVELAGPASSATLLLRNSGGDVVQRLNLGRLGQGLQDLSPQLGTAGLPPGVYRFEVAALAGDQPVTTEPLVTGRVTASVPSATEPLIQLGGVSVPYRDLSAVRDPEAGR